MGWLIKLFYLAVQIKRRSGMLVAPERAAWEDIPLPGGRGRNCCANGGMEKVPLTFTYFWLHSHGPEETHGGFGEAYVSLTEAFKEFI